MDQAKKLRDLVNKHRSVLPEAKSNMRVISVTSGKGGVGKSNFTLNLGIHLARANKRVVIVDADFGLANVEVLLGISPQYSFKEVLAGVVTLPEALAEGPEGLRLLSGGHGLTQLADISEAQMGSLIAGFDELGAQTDIILIDTGAGISKTVVNLLKASHETIVVTTSDPTAIADAYAVIKAISDENVNIPTLKIVINRVENQKEGLDVFNRLYRVCSRFLQIKPLNLGSIPYDRYLARAVKSQEPVTLLYPNAESSRSIEVISKRLLDEPVTESTGIMQFVGRLVGFMKK